MPRYRNPYRPTSVRYASTRSPDASSCHTARRRGKGRGGGPRTTIGRGRYVRGDDDRRSSRRDDGANPPTTSPMRVCWVPPRRRRRRRSNDAFRRDVLLLSHLRRGRLAALRRVEEKRSRRLRIRRYRRMRIQVRSRQFRTSVRMNIPVVIGPPLYGTGIVIILPYR